LMNGQSKAAPSIRTLGNVSQHPLGPLVDEFALDRNVMERLRDMAGGLPAEEIERMRGLVRQFPDHTAPALLLLVAMRRVGMLDWQPKAHSAPQIPRQIVQYWRDKEPPPDVVALMESWGRRNPDCEHLVFDKSAATQFLQAHAPAGALEAFLRAADAPQEADIFRLAYLASEGGFFVDADDKCLVSLDEYVPGSATFIGYQESLGNLAMNFVGATRHHPVVLRGLSHAVEAINRGDHDVVWLSTGPGLLTRVFAQAAGDLAGEEWRSHAFVMESHELNRVVGVHCPARYKKANRGESGEFQPGKTADGERQRLYATT
jgi:mannosyltransferase OCH1-like enzyme